MIITDLTTNLLVSGLSMGEWMGRLPLAAISQSDPRLGAVGDVIDVIVGNAPPTAEVATADAATTIEVGVRGL